MTSTISLEEARKRVESIREQFRESTFRLTRFLGDAERGFDMLRDRKTGIVEKLSAAKAGNPLPPTPGEDVVSVELEVEEVEALETVMEEATAAMSHYPGMLSEMSLIYLIANFEAFLSDLLYVLFTARPEILKSGKQVTVAEVVDADSREALLGDLAQREVSSWTYLSFHEQTTRLSERLGINFEKIRAPLDVVTEAHARRNLLVHRGGVVDERYLESVPGAARQLSYRIESDAQYVKEVADALFALVDGLAHDISSRCLSQASGESHLQ